MKNYKLFTSYKLGNAELKNRIVMSPMTRSRATGNIPNDLMAEYYRQRSGAGLIVTEGTSPSPNGLGYSRIPGIFSNEQVDGWKKITSAVHEKGGKIFVQFMHTGRIGHPFNLPKGAKVLAPSDVKAAGKIWTDQEQLQDYPVPMAMTAQEVVMTKEEYIQAAKNSMTAGFDGVELHGANGYLLEQFLSPITNKRTDNYGGSYQKRSLFVVEVAEAVARAIGKEKTGIRLSPYGVASNMAHYPEIDVTYKYLAEKLNNIGIGYIHLVDHSQMGAPAVPAEIKEAIRKIFKNTLILSGGYDLERAEEDLKNNRANLIAFGRPFINNPDLPQRFMNGWPLSLNPDRSLFYTPGEKGYTDYPEYDGETG
jgi:N-ethylmaleimide reductase